MASSGTSPGVGRWLLAVVILLALAGAGVWWFWPRPSGAPDMTAVLQANARGVGHMDRYKFDDAVTAFEEVVRRAPDWLPGRINLGIALMNTGQDPAHPNLKRATEVFQEILKREPNNPHAHYCLGIILQYKKLGAAAAHFEAVTKIDPSDAHAWCNLGLVLPPEDHERRYQCFAKAVELDPYLNIAVNQLQLMLRRRGEVDRAQQLLARFNALEATEVWYTPARIRYNEMGRYASVLGGPGLTHAGPQAAVPPFTRHDKLQVKLAPGWTWATTDDFPVTPLGELRQGLRQRFGGTLVVFDYNRDGRPDLFLVVAVVRNKEMRSLLLRNDGDGVFTDVTDEVGLGDARGGLGCSVADFDNNGYPDLLIAGTGRQLLYRNVEGEKGRRRFQYVSDQATLDDRLGPFCLSGTWIDLDQDGDLDLVLPKYAANVDAALAGPAGKQEAKSSAAVCLNVGEAPAKVPAEDPPPLAPKFKQVDASYRKGLAALVEPGAGAVAFVIADFDLDGDLDLLLLSDDAVPQLVLNDRLLSFRRAALPATLFTPPNVDRPAPRWNGGLVFDLDRDGRSDLFLLEAGRAPVLLLNKHAPGQKDVKQWFETAPTNSPPLTQAVAVDLDLDGLTDVVALSSERKPTFLQSDGKKLTHKPDALGAGWPNDLVSLTVADFTGDGLPDVLGWSEKEGVVLYRNEGNGNQGVQVQLSGHRRVEKDGGGVTRCNSDGVGTWVSAQSKDLWTGAEYTTLCAGLGQSRLPLLLGVGKHGQAEVVRLRWPDNCWQAEFNLPAGRITRVEETNRKGESCPLLFAWDGRRFVFVNDFLGGGSVGEIGPDGSTRPPRPEESVKIEAHQLRPHCGEYVLKIAEPMSEVTYLDRLQLLVVDHPADVRVYPDERFTLAGPPPSQDLLAWREEIFPAAARDHRGRDVTALLRRWDRDTVKDFARRTWLGLAEEHWVELDFGGRLARFGPKDRLVLCLAGWTDYPYPESLWAADQAGVPLIAPVLERLGEGGRWQTVAAEAGFPAGLPRLMTLEVTGQLGGPRCVLRLRTNMQVYWDQSFVAPLLERTAAKSPPVATGGLTRVTPLEVQRADLAERGCMQEYSPDGKQPPLYDYDRLDRIPVTHLSGKLTRLGEVTELLHERDDRFVIFGPGDELTVRFDARGLPPPKEGWTRSFVLRTWGYCKSTGPFVATGDTVEPLPFGAMSRFPNGGAERYPDTPGHREYRRTYNTRAVGGGR